MIITFYLIFKGGLFSIIRAPQTSEQILNFLITQLLQKELRRLQIPL